MNNAVPKTRLKRSVLVIFSVLGTTGSWAQESTSIVEALSAGKTSLNFRLRNEYVDDNAIAHSANASTLRSRQPCVRTSAYKP